jgi:tetratricopeptide (TPR) repeat protein
MRDAFGNVVSCSSSSALRAYDEAVDAQLHAWPGVRDACNQAIEADPGFALPYALKALALATYARAPDARAALAQAIEKNPGTDREQSFLALVGAILDGKTTQALSMVIEHARRHPTDVLSASTAVGAYGLFAFSGRADHDAARRDFLDILVPHFPSDFPWLLANRGWARIECGDAEEGLAMTLTAIAKRPNNAHNAHHVMHGYFEVNRAENAVAFLEGWLPSYSDTGLMWGHLQWHGALAELALDQRDAAMRRLLGPIVAYLPHGTPFMVLADIASLLWRMGLHGIRPLPWTEAQRLAAEHFTRGSNPFGEMHLAILAAAGRDRAGLDAVARRLQLSAENGHQGAVAALHWTKALQALTEDDQTRGRRHLEECRRGVVQVGGSHAQRSIVDETLETLVVPSAI